jgi:hypothetical protein
LAQVVGESAQNAQTAPDQAPLPPEREKPS